MKKKTQVLVVVMIIGIVLTAVGLGDAMTFLSGKVVDFNDASIGDFDEKALAKGEIFYVDGPFATLEQSQKRYGVTTSKTETNYYVVAANMDKESWENGDVDDAFYVVLAVSNKDLISELDSAVSAWDEYYNGDADVPDISIDIKGKLAKQSDESDYKKYRDDFLRETDVPVAEMMIQNGEIGVATFVFVGVGLVLALGSLIILIVSAVKKKKEKAEELY
ncbi:MAG: hypothetical protein NC485_03775 [Ruminococcus flavefaciens]|nr:hypothetical protein [Ruminococcus flavefaciens]MCM1058805.1 hypothetical protein [Eubacterium sp.]